MRLTRSNQNTSAWRTTSCPRATAALKEEVRDAVSDLQAEVAELRQQVAAEPEASRRQELDLELQAATKRLREAEEKVLNAILPRAFALVREAAKRTLGERHFDVQLIGGIVLHQGKIAEMKTGEGKTLVATLPLYLNCPARPRRASGHAQRLPVQVRRAVDGAHLPPAGSDRGRDPVGGGRTRDSALSSTTPTTRRPTTATSTCARCARREAYLADITYGTNNEFGFDYLRDNMVVGPDAVRAARAALCHRGRGGQHPH